MVSPHKTAGGSVDCYDVLQDVDDVLRDSMLPGQQYYVLGGIASGALANAGTVIDPESKSVVATATTALPTMRPNGTRRDIDILVNTVLEDVDGARIKSSVAQAIGDKLMVSVFGIEEHHEAYSKAGWLVFTAKDWVSHRTIDNNGVLRYELFPVERAVTAESYEPWKLVLPSGQHLDVLHPAGHTLAYSMRSISGVRAKDRPKFESMRRNVLPKFEAEVREGLFKPWVDFAKDIETLRVLNMVSIDGLRSNAKAFDVSAFRFKARALHWLESHERIVDFAQADTIQRLLNTFVRAK